MTSVAAYTLYQGVMIPGDPGINGAQQADLLTYLGDTQPIEGGYSDHNLTVTLDYTYANANRITVSYTERGESSDGRRLMAYSNPTLSTVDGQSLNRLLLLADHESQEPAEDGETQTFSNALRTRRYFSPVLVIFQKLRPSVR